MAVFLFVLALLVDFALGGCATRSTPSGGPRDTTAPRVDTSFPANGSLNFEGNEISIEFNEYISLKSPREQISFSPPLNEKPEFELRGKELTIRWQDTLLENTTYTISFGEAITDFTEGNVNGQIKFVFSTGDYLDSLRFSGRVIDSRTAQPEKEMLVALYDLSSLKQDDSVMFKTMPAYYTYTDENGNFNLENLKYGSFHLIAFNDKRGNFRLNTGTEKIAFLSDSLVLSDSTEAVELHSFMPKPEKRFFGARHSGNGQLEIAFSYTPDSVKIRPLYPDSTDAVDFIVWDENRDTATYWFEQSDRDSIVIVVEAAPKIADTSVVFLRPFKEKKLELAPVNSEIAFYTDPEILGNRPLTTIDPKKIWLYTPKDTSALDSFYLVDPLRFALILPKKPKEFSLYFMAGALKSFDGKVNDSLILEFKTLRRDELGSLLFGVAADTNQARVLVFNDENGEYERKRSFKGTVSLELANEKPGMYQAYLIMDRNEDGSWTTGDYFLRRQPEEIIRYGEPIEIRANWELELLWDLSGEQND